jgi:hypothetical protein
MFPRVLPGTVFGLVFGVTVQTASAAVLTFDFDAGPGPSFTTFNASGLFTLDLDGPDFRASKPSDDGTVLPTSFISGGIRTVFSLEGDFTVTVDFALDDLPPATPGTIPLNESVLGVVGSEPGESFLVLRFQQASSNRIEAFSSSIGPIGAADSTLMTGRYQIERSGDTLIGRYAEAGSSSFATLGSASGYASSLFQVQLSGVQGASIGGDPRSTTSLDVSFDDLVIEVDVVVPEPGTLVLASLCLLGVLLVRRPKLLQLPFPCL